MAKFFGKIAYSMTKETAPGVWTPIETIREYYGDINRNSRNWNNSESINDNLQLSNEISIVADNFAYENFNAIKWVEWSGAKWRINGVDIAYPRLILRLGGVYNAEDEASGTT